MRILALVTTDLVYDQRMQRICRSLTEAGHEVKLVGRRKADSPPLFSQVFAQRRLHCWWQRGKIFYLEYNLRLFFLLLFARYDAINAVDLDTLVPAVLVGQLRGKPVVYDAHEYFSETPEVVRRPRIQRMWERVARWGIPRTAVRYTVGPALAEIMGKRYGSPFGVVRNISTKKSTAEVEPTSEIALSESPILLYQGALNEGRGILEVLHALPLVPRAHLHLAGEGDLSTRLRAETERLGLSDRVTFHGFLRPPALRALTERADIGLNLLEDRGLSYHYSLANKAFDYLRAGVPSVHMDFPEYRALHETYGVFSLIPDLQPAGIARALNDLLEDSAHYQNRRTAALRAAQELTWEREATGLVEIWEEVAASTDAATR